MVTKPMGVGARTQARDPLMLSSACLSPSHGGGDGGINPGWTPKSPECVAEILCWSWASWADWQVWAYCGRCSHGSVGS